MNPVVIGTRGSPLALAQSGQVRDALAARWPQGEFRLQVIKTGGDAWAARPAGEGPPPGKGIFTREIEEALRDGSIALAVHSLKDMPVEDAPGLVLAALPERADARDVLVTRGAADLAALPPGARIGTGSLRRSAQLLAARPDLQTGPIRGNIDTRLRRLAGKEWDAILLAAAGLERLRPALETFTVVRLPFELMLPAPGQGALALQARADDAATQALLAAIDHAPTRAAVTAERAFLAALGGGCLSPVGAYASVDGEVLKVQGIAWLGDSPEPVSGEAVGTLDQPEALGQKLARQLQAT